MKKVTVVCNTCGNDSVLRDAWSQWDGKQWVLQNVFDDAYCETCDGECSYSYKEIDEFTAFVDDTDKISKETINEFLNEVIK